MANKIQLRRDTTANWERINPILADGEPGLDITLNKLKMGDGTTTWHHLPFLSSDVSASIVAGNYAAVIDNTGTLTVPGTISATDGVTISTGRGDVQFGANLEAPGVATHFHINKTSASTNNVDLFFGDDSDYVKLPAGGGVVQVTADTGSTWTFETNGYLTVPASGVIRSTNGDDGPFIAISGIAVDGAGLVTIDTATAHGLANGYKIYITGITTTTGLNNQSFYVNVVNPSAFRLYNDVDQTFPFDGSGLTAYTVPASRTVNASPTNTPVIATDVSPWGAGYNSIQFNGAANGYLEVAANGDFGIGYQEFSISFWVYQNSYANNTRLFAFNSWPYERLSLSSESASQLFLWLNANPQGGQTSPIDVGGLELNTWNHVVVTRYAGVLYVVVNGVQTWGGTNSDDLYLTGALPLTIGNELNHDAGLDGYIRDFKFNVGQGIDPASLSGNLPTGPATADTGYTKLLVLGDSNTADWSQSTTAGGGGTIQAKYQGPNINIETADNPNGSDPGQVVLRAGSTRLKVDDQRQVISKSDGMLDYPINSSGQQTFPLSTYTETNPITEINLDCNLLYAIYDYNYSGGTGHTIVLPVPTRAGVKLTIVNDTPTNLNIDVGNGTYTMNMWENIHVMSVRNPYEGFFWWVTGAFSW